MLKKFRVQPTSWALFAPSPPFFSCWMDGVCDYAHRYHTAILNLCLVLGWDK